MPRLRGNRFDNDLYIHESNLYNTWINGRRGFDTLHIVGDDDISLEFSTTRRWKNLEEIDFSDYTGNITLTIDDYLLSRNGDGNLSVVSSNAATLTLSAEASVYGSVTISGNGNVNLADGINNVVQLGIGTGIVIGGTGEDTITANSLGSILNGGNGNDTLVGNFGADIFVHDAGSGQDTFVNFDVSSDVINLSGTGITSLYELQQIMEDGPAAVTINFTDGSSIVLPDISATDLGGNNFTANGNALAEYPETITFEPGISAQDLNDLIADVPAGTTIILAEGTHVFTGSILIDRSDITLRGESESGTVLEFNFPEGTGGNFIKTTGGEKTYVDTLNLSAEAGATSITTDLGHGLSIGDAIYLFQPNTQEYLDKNGWNNVDIEDADSRPFREFITTVESINNGIITFSDPLPYDFSAGETRIFSVELLDGISISNFSVTNNLGDINPYDFVNTQPDFEGSVAIDLTGTQNLNLSGVTIINAPSTGIGLTSTINANIDDINILGSHNLGGGGNGYGIELAEAFNNSLTGLDIFDVRHSVIFSAWNAETSNTIQINETNRDINFHGSPDNDNSVSVGIAILDYDESQDSTGDTQWALVSGGGASFAETNTFADNDVEFAYAEGGDRVDTIHGFDGGAYLNGHGSNDILFGGDGDDILVGGRRRDTMTGNEGSDTFIFNFGDDLDTITDFEFGSTGDLFVIMGNPDVDSFDDLTLTQSGDDVRVRYGSNSTVVLENTDLTEINADNFVFDPDSEVYLDLWNGING